MADVSVSGRGSVLLFTLHTDAARDWVDAHVQLEGYQWMGASSFAVEHRFASDLADGMMEAGLAVE